MSYVTLKNKIKSELLTLSTIHQVGDYPKLDFSGFPSANVRSDEKSGQYETTSENYEEFIFTVYLVQNIEGDVWTPEKSREIIEELTDEVCDHFDENEFLTGIAMPNGKTFIGIRPTNSKIFEEEAGKYAIGEIKLACRVTKTI